MLLEVIADIARASRKESKRSPYCVGDPRFSDKFPKENYMDQYPLGDERCRAALHRNASF